MSSKLGWEVGPTGRTVGVSRRNRSEREMIWTDTRRIKCSTASPPQSHVHVDMSPSAGKSYHQAFKISQFKWCVIVVIHSQSTKYACSSLLPAPLLQLLLCFAAKWTENCYWLVGAQIGSGQVRLIVKQFIESIGRAWLKSRTIIILWIRLTR